MKRKAVPMSGDYSDVWDDRMIMNVFSAAIRRNEPNHEKPLRDSDCWYQKSLRNAQFGEGEGNTGNISDERTQVGLGEDENQKTRKLKGDEEEEGEEEGEIEDNREDRMFNEKFQPAVSGSEQGIPAGAGSSAHENGQEFPFSQQSAAYQASQLFSADMMHDEVQAALSSMLMSWYYSGYATGRYHAMVDFSKKKSSSDRNEEN
jgi:hypothetical protein